MYEIWLGMNILYELMWNYLSFVLAVVVSWVILMTYAIQKGAAWRRGLRGGLVGMLVVIVVSFLGFPSLTMSSLGNLGYWIDYLFLFQIALAYGVVFGLGFVWPIAAIAARTGPKARLC